MKEYLEKRIKELREADAAFCKDRWNMELPEFLRENARGHSNSVTLARQELESVLAFLNK